MIFNDTSLIILVQMLLLMIIIMIMLLYKNAIEHFKKVNDPMEVMETFLLIQYTDFIHDLQHQSRHNRILWFLIFLKQF